MPGRRRAPATGRELVDATKQLGEFLNLNVYGEVRVGRRLWGAVRKIDLVLIEPQTRRTLGIECKAQGTRGSAEEKIPATIDDIVAWPIPGLVVSSGSGFTPNIRQDLIETGKPVEIGDLEVR